MQKKNLALVLILLAFACLAGCSTSPTLLVENQNAVWLMHEDGSGAVKIVDNARFPKWIPQTKNKIAFARFEGDRAAIFTTAPDGTKEKKLTPYIASGDYSWSPDRNWIVYETHAYGKWQIFKVNIETTQNVRLTDNSSNNRKPRWAPTGDKIAFQSDRRHGDWDVWIMDAAGKTGQNLQNATNGVAGDGYDGEAAWSPDGKYIAHQCDHIGWGGPKICIAALATETDPGSTGPVSQHASGKVGPIWSPGGDFLFYVDSENNLYKYEVATKQEQIVAHGRPDSSATSYLDGNETTVFFNKGNDLYNVKWRADDQWKLTQGQNPDVW